MLKEITEIKSILGGYSDLSPEDRDRAVSFAMAKCIAYKMELPSSEVSGTLRLIYKERYEMMAKDKISEVNESYPVDVTSCLDLIYRIWEARYRAAFDPKLLNVRRLLGAAEISTIPPRFEEMSEKCCQAADRISNIF